MWILLISAVLVSCFRFLEFYAIEGTKNELQDNYIVGYLQTNPFLKWKIRKNKKEVGIAFLFFAVKKKSRKSSVCHQFA